MNGDMAGFTIVAERGVAHDGVQDKQTKVRVSVRSAMKKRKSMMHNRVRVHTHSAAKQST
jgi:hypothetical protein